MCRATSRVEELCNPKRAGQRGPPNTLPKNENVMLVRILLPSFGGAKGALRGYPFADLAA
jgi:hypothetical protein